jgi:hypothetical protein
MQLKAAALQNPLRTNLRNFLGMLRRLPRKGQLRTGRPS